MAVVEGGARTNLITGLTRGWDGYEKYGKDHWLAQTFPLDAQYVVWRCLVKSFTDCGAKGYQYYLRATDGAGKPAGPNLAVTGLSPSGETGWKEGHWRRFDFPDWLDLLPGTYALIASVTDCPVTTGYKLMADTTSPPYTGGKAWFSDDSGVTWSEIPGIDFMFQIWGYPSPPSDPPSPTISNWAPITYTKALVEDAYWIQVTTDIPVHLFMRYTLTKPLTHPVALFRRGISLPNATRFCFVNWHENEQEEEGDTLIHTFYKPNWPICQTRWFYFIGTKQTEESPSASPIFTHHREQPPERIDMKILAEMASRTLESTHGVWPTCWAGSNLSIHPHHLAPFDRLLSTARLDATYWIRRGQLFFYLPVLPTGSTILSAKLSIFPISHTTPEVNLCITEGMQTDPVDTPDWAPQNPKDTIFGVVNYADLVDDQYNDIPFNQDGLDWLTWALTRSHQFESYDVGHNTYIPFYEDTWPCMQHTPEIDHTSKSLLLRLKKYDGTPATIYVKVYRCNPAGEPTGVPLCSGEIDGATLSTATWGAWRQVDLGDGVRLQPAFKYIIVLSSPGSDDDNHPAWICDSSGLYTGGHLVFSFDGGSTWDMSYVNYDALFLDYNHRYQSARKLALRSSYDVMNLPPPLPPPLPSVTATQDMERTPPPTSRYPISHRYD